MKRRRFMLENKLNMKKPPENYLKPHFHILPLTVKRDLIKNYRINNKKSVCFSHFNVSTKNNFINTFPIKEILTARPS